MSAQIINRFGRNINLIRKADPIFADGFWTQPAGETVTVIKASVQPLTADDLEMLPEGSETGESLKLFTLEKLRMRSGDPIKNGDFVDIDGKIYEIISLKDYVVHKAMNLSYYKAIALGVAQ